MPGYRADPPFCPGITAGKLEKPSRGRQWPRSDSHGLVAVHPSAAEQDRPAGTGANRAVDGPPDRWRQRDQDGLGPFAAYAQHPVAVFFAEVVDVRSGGFEDPQPEQAEHGDKREVARVRGLPGRGEQCLELQVGKSQRR